MDSSLVMLKLYDLGQTLNLSDSEMGWFWFNWSRGPVLALRCYDLISLCSLFSPFFLFWYSFPFSLPFSLSLSPQPPSPSLYPLLPKSLPFLPSLLPKTCTSLVSPEYCFSGLQILLTELRGIWPMYNHEARLITFVQLRVSVRGVAAVRWSNIWVCFKCRKTWLQILAPSLLALGYYEPLPMSLLHSSSTYQVAWLVLHSLFLSLF